MQINKTQYDALSRKAVKVISPEVIRSMSAAQRGLLNQALGRILAKRGSVASRDARDAGTSRVPFANSKSIFDATFRPRTTLFGGRRSRIDPFRPGFSWATMRLIRQMGWGYTPSPWHACFKG